MLDRERIRQLIAEGELLVQNPNAQGIVAASVHEAYVKAGLHRRMTEEQFAQEVSLGASLLLKDIESDNLFRLLRAGELSYCFDCGLKGRLGQTGGGDVTYRTLVQWIEVYVTSAERRAEQAAEVEKRKKEIAATKLTPLPAHLTPESIADETRAAYREYREWRAGGGALRAKKQKRGGIISIGEALGAPISCRDFGYRKIRWLSSQGFAFEGETLMDAFERMYIAESEMKMRTGIRTPPAAQETRQPR